ncbi:hypothetical protein JKF63_07404 [Porcisia hertigi]|uniref:Kinesin motor domain-containing protein n=1 Tax=Porcisia hertigi TaxID=2761500 RepID=A0A837A9J6_9TRYP|nr:hypothetical protein JKF63_07404 [Porcisia hertigi]
MAQQTDLHSTTLQQPTEGIPPLCASKDGAPPSSLQNTSGDRFEGEQDFLQDASSSPESTNKQKPHPLARRVPTSLHTATDKSLGTSTETTASMSATDIADHSPSQPQRSQHTPGLAVSAGSCSRRTVHKDLATFIEWQSAHDTAATASVAPPKESAGARDPQQQQPAQASVSYATDPTFTGPQKSSAASMRAGQPPVAAFTTKASETPNTYPENPKDQTTVLDSNNAKAGVKSSCVDADPCNPLQEDTEVAEVGALGRHRQQQYDTTVKLPAKSSTATVVSPNAETVDSENVADAAPLLSEPPRRDETRSGKAELDIVAAGDGEEVADGHHRSVRRHTTETQASVQEDDRLAIHETRSATPPLSKSSPARSEGNTTELAATVKGKEEENDGVADGGMTTFVAVRVRPRASLLTHNAALSNAEHDRPRKLHGATLSRQQSANTQAGSKLVKTEPIDADGPNTTEEESCVRVDAASGSILCVPVAAARVSGGANTMETSAANGSAVEQRTRALSFHFDNVFDDRATQEDVMEIIGKRAVARVLQGYNGTVMCYGQSGSGKTHTIAGLNGGVISKRTLRWLASRTASGEALEHHEDDDDDDDDGERMRVAANIGLLPRMLHRLFLELEAKHGGGKRRPNESAAPPPPSSSWQVTLSALELYNENLRDLLPGDLLKEKGKVADKETSHPSAAAHRHSDSGPSVDGRRNSSDDDDDDDEPAASRPTVNTLESNSMAGSPVKRGCSQPPISSSSSAVSMRRSVSQRVGAVGGNPVANRGRLTSHNRTSPATGSSKRASTRWAAQTATREATPLQIRQEVAPARSAGGDTVYIKGLREHRVNDLQEAMEAVQLALKQRHVGSTALNQKSSRSHAFFFVRVEQREHRSLDESKAVSYTRRSTLTLVDLAGSERVGHSGAHGLRLKEAQNINRSLSALGNVMRQLSSASSGSPSNPLMPSSSSGAASLTGPTADPHIPYRDSKLTHILQSNLGGNAITFLLCNISPDLRDAQETISTLRFAKLSKTVKSHAKLNETATCTTDAQAAAAALAKIHQLAGDVAAAQNRLKQLATYTWWLEGHLSYFAAATFQQQYASTLNASAAIGAIPSPPLSHGGGSARGLLHETPRAPRVVCSNSSGGAGNAGVSSLEPLMSLERGIENEERTPLAAAQEWWCLAPRPPSPRVGADDDGEEEVGGGGDKAVEESAYWDSASARALLSPTYPITQRRMELQRKLIAAASALSAGATAGATTLSPRLAAAGTSLMALPYSPAALPRPRSTDSAVGEVESIVSDCAVDDTLLLESVQSMKHGLLTHDSPARGAIKNNAGGDMLAAADAPQSHHHCSTASTAGIGTGRSNSGGMATVQTTGPIGDGVRPTAEKMQTLASHPPEPQREHEHPLGSPLLSLTTGSKRPQPLQSESSVIKAVGAATSHERPTPAASEAYVMELEQANVLLRLRLAEQQRLLREEEGRAHVTESRRSTYVPQPARKGVMKDAPGEPSDVVSVTTASATAMPWPPHYSPVSADASLEAFLARCGFAAMDPLVMRGAEVSPRRLAYMYQHSSSSNPASVRAHCGGGTHEYEHEHLASEDKSEGEKRYRIAARRASTTMSPRDLEGVHGNTACLDRDVKSIDVAGASIGTPRTHSRLGAPVSSSKSSGGINERSGARGDVGFNSGGSDADCASSLTASLMSSAPPLWTTPPQSKQGGCLFTVYDYPPSLMTSARDNDGTAQMARAAVHQRQEEEPRDTPLLNELGAYTTTTTTVDDEDMLFACLSVDSLHQPSTPARGSGEQNRGLLERLRTTFATARALRKHEDFSGLDDMNNLPDMEITAHEHHRQ